jgi:uncharacterized protein YcfJ
MKRISMTALAAGLLALAAPGAWAQPMANARVVSATPMVESVPVTQCAPAYGQPTGGGAAVGALVGGLVGSQLGQGSGQIAGAILGTLGGAFAGNAIEAQQAGYDRCQTTYQQQVTGYDVRYEWGGRIHRTQMAQAPGVWIQVPVASGYGQPQPPDAAWDGGVVQSYPVAPPVAAYPLPAEPPQGVVTAPRPTHRRIRHPPMPPAPTHPTRSPWARPSSCGRRCRCSSPRWA